MNGIKPLCAGCRTGIDDEPERIQYVGLTVE